LAQTFTWVNARNNTHGVNTPGAPTNPMYCTTQQTSTYQCNMADDQTWSRISLTQVKNSLVRLAGTPVDGTTVYTYYDTSPLKNQECSDCIAGYSWGSQDDTDYLDFYNGKFMGFARVDVSN